MLGAAAEAVAVESLRRAADAIELLGPRTAGRAALVIASAPAARSATAAGLPTGGAAGRSTWSRCPPSSAPPPSPCWRRAWSWTTSRPRGRLVEQRPGLRAVTRTGDLLGAHDAEGGSAGGTSVLQVRAALDEAAADLDEAATPPSCRDGAGGGAEAERGAQSAVEAAQARAAEAQTGVRTRRPGSTRRRPRWTGSGPAARGRPAGRRGGQAARPAGAAAEAARDECERLAGSVAAAEEARDRDLPGSPSWRSGSPRPRTPRSSRPSPTTETRDELAAICATARQAEMEARLAVRTAEERVRGTRGPGRRADARPAGARARGARQGRRAARAARRSRPRRPGGRPAAPSGRCSALEASLAVAAASERDEAELARGQIDAELKAVRCGSASYRRAGPAGQPAHGSEVARTEQRLRLEQLETRALEEYGVEADALIREYGPDQPVRPRPRGPREARPVRPGRRRPGEAGQGRRPADGPARQGQPARAGGVRGAGGAALLPHLAAGGPQEDPARPAAVVKEVDERVEQVFAAAFADVAREFETIFTRVFPGGEGRLCSPTRRTC